MMFTYQKNSGEKNGGRSCWVDMGQGSREQNHASPPSARPRLFLIAGTDAPSDARK
jgi:hypothetical protein